MSITRSYPSLETLLEDIRIARARPTADARDGAISEINCHLWPAKYSEVAASLGVTPGMSITSWVKAGKKRGE